MGEGGRRRGSPRRARREAVERARASGVAIVAVAEDPGLHEVPRAAVAPGLRGPGRDEGPEETLRRPATPTALPGPSPADLAAEAVRLRRELERARMERGIVRKAALAIVLGPTADDGSLFGGPPGEVRARG